MGKGRLEAFSDGVLAIIITIMVLELKVPHGTSLDALLPLVPVFLSYVLSFVYVGIYWNNHHHMLHATHTVSGGILWANLHLLFWLSLFPFTTAWMGENHFQATPSAIYGVVLHRLLAPAAGHHRQRRGELGPQGRRGHRLEGEAVPPALPGRDPLHLPVRLAGPGHLRRGGARLAHPRSQDRAGAAAEGELMPVYPPAKK